MPDALRGLGQSGYLGMITKPIDGGTMTLLPPAPHLCQTCATKHEPEMPHNAQSLYYQTAFNMEHGRTPDWRDAMAHCSEEMRAAWTKGLSDAGIDVEGGQISPAKRRG